MLYRKRRIFMNNLVISCTEFIADTYGNRPRNADGTLIPYTEDERKPLKDTVQHHIDDVEAHKNEIPQATYELIRAIYELVQTQLDNRQI